MIFTHFTPKFTLLSWYTSCYIFEKCSWKNLQIQSASAHLLYISGTKAGVRHHATAAGQLWAEWEERHAAGGEEDTWRGDQALESSNPGEKKN